MIAPDMDIPIGTAEYVRSRAEDWPATEDRGDDCSRGSLPSRPPKHGDITHANFGEDRLVKNSVLRGQCDNYNLNSHRRCNNVELIWIGRTCDYI